MLRHLCEWDVAVKAAHGAQLDEEQQRRRGILEPRHHRLRREFDQCSELDEAEQRLQHTAEENDPECNRENERNAARDDGRCMRNERDRRSGCRGRKCC